MGMSKRSLCEQHQVSDGKLRRLMKACGLNTAQTEYEPAEVSRLEAALQMQAKGQTLEAISAHFGIAAQPQSEELSQAVVSAARDIVSSSQGSRDRAMGLLDEVAQVQAQQIAPVADRMLLTHLSHELRDGTQSRQFWGDVRKEVMLQMQEGEFGGGNRLDSPATPALSSSLPSSDNSSTTLSSGSLGDGKSLPPSNGTACAEPDSNSKSG